MLERGFYHNGADGRVYYVTGGKRYWVPDQDELYRVTAGRFYDVVAYGRESEFMMLPAGDYNTIKAGPFPIGGDAGAASGGAPGGGVQLPALLGGGVLTQTQLMGVALVGVALLFMVLLRRR